MKFKEDRPLANPEAAMAKLLEISNALEADHAGRISVGAINHFVCDTKANDGSQFIARLLGLLSVALGHAFCLSEYVGKDAKVGRKYQR
jgi:hypothetical protein